MDKEKAYKVAEMYKNAAENEKDSKKANDYFKKAANYYIKLSDIENTIICLHKVGLVESNLNLLLQKLNAVEVVEYFQSHNQTKLFLLSLAIALDKEYIHQLEFHSPVPEYYDFDSILKKKFNLVKDEIGVHTTILLLNSWNFMEINEENEIQLIKLLEKYNHEINYLLLSLLIQLRKSVENPNETNNDEIEKIRIQLIKNYGINKSHYIIRILIPVLLFEGKNIDVLAEISDELQLKEYTLYIKQLAGFIKNYEFDNAMEVVRQSNKMETDWYGMQPEIKTFNDVVIRLINSKYYHPETLLLKILENKKKEFISKLKEIEELYNSAYVIKNPAKLLTHLEKVFEHSLINTFNDDVIQEILEQICLLAYDQENFEKYDNYSSILENLYGVDMNKALMEIIQSNDE